MGQYTVDENTLSLLHFEDGFKDECTPGFSWESNAVVITSDNKIFGNKSLKFTDKSSSGLTVPFNIVGEFTVEFYLFVETKNNGGILYFRDSSDTLSRNAVVYIDGYRGGCGVLNTGYVDGQTKVPLNTWVHFAFVKKASTYSIYIDEKLAFETNDSEMPLKYITIGGNHNVTNGWYDSFTGYIDELRVSNIARIPGLVVTPAPTNLAATGGDTKVTLSWNAVTGATGYNIKRSTTAGGPYTTIASNVTGTSYEDTSVVNGTTYYYVVTAMGANGESANSNEASATPQASTGRGLLRVTMTDSSEREYNLSAPELDAFISWYRAVGSDKTCYVFNKSVGSHSSKEYLAYDKILSFEVTSLPVA